MSVRRLFAALSLGLAACTATVAPDLSHGSGFVVVSVARASYFTPDDAAPALVVDATIRNPSSSAVTILPDCGGDFAIERWSNGQWVPWGLFACRSPDLVTIGPQASRAANRSFAIERGSFRLVVHEGLHENDRVAYSESFDR